MSTKAAAQGKIPSYARPTAASEKRRIPTSIVSTSGNHSQQTKSKPESSAMCAASEPKIIYHYSFSTSASRSKATWPPFKLLSLPPELRNRVYERIIFHNYYRTVNFWKAPERHWPRMTLPPVLAANKQLLDELGGYFFDKGDFIFVVPGYSIEKLIAWLKLIGRSNCNHILRRTARIRFVVRPQLLTPLEQSGDALARVLQLGDAAVLAGFGPEIHNLSNRYPLLLRWKVQTWRKNSNPYDSWWQDSDDYKRRDDDPIPLTYFGRLPGVFNALLRLCGKEPVNPEVADGRSVKWWRKSPKDTMPMEGVERYQFFRMKSGRLVFVDTHA